MVMLPEPALHIALLSLGSSKTIPLWADCLLSFTAMATRETLEVVTLTIGPKMRLSGPASEPALRRAVTLTAVGEEVVAVKVPPL